MLTSMLINSWLKVVFFLGVTRPLLFLMLVWKMSFLLMSLGNSVRTRFEVGPVNHLQSRSYSEMPFRMLKRLSLGLQAWTGQACFFNHEVQYVIKS